VTMHSLYNDFLTTNYSRLQQLYAF